MRSSFGVSDNCVPFQCDPVQIALDISQENCSRRLVDPHSSGAGVRLRGFSSSSWIKC